MKQVVPHLFLFVALSILPVGNEACAGTDSSPGTTAKQAPKAIPLSGKVLETMDGGGYTYVLLKNGDDKVWVAIPIMKASVGQDLTLSPGYEFKNFNSKGLNRKFDRVIFSAGVINQEVKLTPAALKIAHQGMPGNTPNAAAAAPQTAAAAPKADKPLSVNLAKNAKAKGPNSYTIAQVYSKKSKLEKKTVVVRGKVVKVSSRIMKRNWIHIQDGSGSESKKNHELVITSTELPKEGSVVTAEGILYNNLDFGSGYKYVVLIEGAHFK